MTRRMIASVVTSRKRVTRPCTMTSPQAPAICPKERVNLVSDHLHALVLVLGLALAQTAGATVTIMLIKTTASRVQHPSKGIHPSMGTCTPPIVTMARMHSSPRQKRYCVCHLLRSESNKEVHPDIGNRASREIKCPCVCLCSR
jgi:hypothetical protein